MLMSKKKCTIRMYLCTMMFAEFYKALYRKMTLEIIV